MAGIEGFTVVGSKEEVWRERVEAWRVSGQSQSEFCRGRGFSKSSLSRWISQLAPQLGTRGRKALRRAMLSAQSERPAMVAETQRWAEVMVPAVAAESESERRADAASGELELVVPGGWCVRLGSGFEAAALERLLSVLEGRSC
jgi:hypothetical protein